MDEQALDKLLQQADDNARVIREREEAELAARKAHEALQRRGKACLSTYNWARYRFRKLGEALFEAGHVADSAYQNETAPIKLAAKTYPELGEGWMVAILKGYTRGGGSKPFDKAEAFDVVFGFLPSDGSKMKALDVNEYFTPKNTLKAEDKWKSDVEVEAAERHLDKILPSAKQTVSWLQSAVVDVNLNPELARTLLDRGDLYDMVHIPELPTDA